MTILMCVVWIILFTLTLLAFWKGKIFLAKDEDVWMDTVVKDEDEEKQAGLSF